MNAAADALLRVKDLRVDFGDVPSWELHDSRLAQLRLIRSDQNGHTNAFAL